MNQCQLHFLPLVGQCKFARCENFIGCSVCFQKTHQFHEYTPIQMVNQTAPNTQKYFFQNQPPQQNPVQKALNIFDEQFDRSMQDLTSSVNQMRGNMRQQYEQFLRQLPNEALGQYLQGNPIPPIANLFNAIDSSIQKSFQQPEPIPIIDLNFNEYLIKFNIPAFIQGQLNKFTFDRQEFENPNIKVLTEENRELSLIVGQKDPNTGLFSGRSMIIYRQQPAAIYLGYVKDNMRHGKGILVIDDFKYYLGEFYNNMEWGYGELQLINSAGNSEKYVGYFSEGKRCGCGEAIELIQNSKQQEQQTIPYVEYFNNVLHGPKIKGKEFELYQYGESYFKVGTKEGLKNSNCQVTSLGITESRNKGFIPQLQVDDNFLASQFVPNPYDIIPQPQPVQQVQPVMKSVINKVIYDKNNK